MLNDHKRAIPLQDAKNNKQMHWPNYTNTERVKGVDDDDERLTSRPSS